MIFSDPVNRTGVIQSLEDLTSTQSSSSSSYTLAVKTKDINLAMDDYQNLVKQVSGTWQVDDTNHTRYPNMKFNLVSGQQDYAFTVDEQGNQVQDIYRVECKDASGNWRLLKAIDEMRLEDAISTIETQTGTPVQYWKTANGIFLKLAPNYSSVQGIRMFFTRSPNYFVSTDTSKIAGMPNGHQKYLFWKSAYWFWLPRDSTRANAFKIEVDKIEDEVREDISKRNRDERTRFVPKYTNYN